MWAIYVVDNCGCEFYGTPDEVRCALDAHYEMKRLIRLMDRVRQQAYWN